MPANGMTELWITGGLINHGNCRDEFSLFEMRV